MKRQHLNLALTALVTASILLIAGRTLALRNTGVLDQLNLIVDVRNEIVDRYVETPDHDELIESAVRGMIDSLDDNYTEFFNLGEMEDFNRTVGGEFSGIGAEVNIKNGQLHIVSPLEDSPAWKAGVMSDDIVLEIDGIPTIEVFGDARSNRGKLQNAIELLLGDSGTLVKLLVRRASGAEAHIEITRARINVPTIKGIHRDTEGHWHFMLDEVNKIGYVRLTQFTKQTDVDLREALDQLIEDDVQGLILDLRFNPGGLLESAVLVSEKFLSEEKRIVSVKGRSVDEQMHDAAESALLPEIPMVVLANEVSASASEIVTGALADNGRAKFIGTRTFGKGSVQEVRMLANHRGKPIGMLKMTNAHWYTPNGRNIHRKSDAKVWGVDPEDGFYVPMSPDQIRKMIEIRRDSDILKDTNGNSRLPTITPEWVENDFGDLQLAAGLRSILGKIETGEWPIVGISGVDLQVKLTQREAQRRRRNLLQEELQRVEETLAELDEELDGKEPQQESETAPAPEDQVELKQP